MCDECRVPQYRTRPKRRCGKCGLEKSTGEFSRSKNAYSWCLACCAVNAAAWRERNRDRVRATDRERSTKRRQDPEYRQWMRAYKLLRNYDLTMDQFAAMIEAQEGRCAICANELALGRAGLHVDHDHATGAVRGLLCRGCNHMLGNADDDPERLRRGAAYLEQPREAHRRVASPPRR